MMRKPTDDIASWRLQQENTTKPFRQFAWRANVSFLKRMMIYKMQGKIDREESHDFLAVLDSSRILTEAGTVWIMI